MNKIEDEQKLRDNMFRLLGAINAISFPLIWTNNEIYNNTAYYDLLENLVEQYDAILVEMWG